MRYIVILAVLVVGGVATAVLYDNNRFSIKNIKNEVRRDFQNTANRNQPMNPAQQQGGQPMQQHSNQQPQQPMQGNNNQGQQPVGIPQQPMNTPQSPNGNMIPPASQPNDQPQAPIGNQQGQVLPAGLPPQR